MIGLVLVIPVLLIIFISYLIVRGAATALMLTGLDGQTARFQSLSAFSGTGFTTRETEEVINNPRRRRIIVWLMVLGNAGIVSVIVGLSSSIITSEGCMLYIDILVLVVGIFIVYQLVRRNVLARRVERLIENRIRRSSVRIPLIEDLVILDEGYGVVRIIVPSESQAVGETLLQLNLVRENDKSVLGIERSGHWVNSPVSSEVVRDGDKLTIYGNMQEVKDVFSKPRP